MELEARIDWNGADGAVTGELALSNWNEQVRIQCGDTLFKGSIYLDRAELLRALCALDVGSE